MTLDYAKSKQIGILRAEFELKIDEGYYMNSGSITNFFLRGDKGLQRLKCADELIKSGNLLITDTIYDSNMVAYTMTQAELDDILNQAKLYGYSCISNLYNKISQVQSATTIAEVEAIVL